MTVTDMSELNTACRPTSRASIWCCTCLMRLSRAFFQRSLASACIFLSSMSDADNKVLGMFCAVSVAAGVGDLGCPAVSCLAAKACAAASMFAAVGLFGSNLRSRDSGESVDRCRSRDAWTKARALPSKSAESLRGGTQSQSVGSTDQVAARDYCDASLEPVKAQHDAPQSRAPPRAAAPGPRCCNAKQARERRRAHTSVMVAHTPNPA
jgi:hypothetical protein